MHRDLSSRPLSTTDLPASFAVTPARAVVCVGVVVDMTLGTMGLELVLHQNNLRKNSIDTVIKAVVMQVRNSC